MEFQIGQVKLIYRNGGFSVLIRLENSEIIVNAQPQNVNTDKAVVQLFVMPIVESASDAK